MNQKPTNYSALGSHRYSTQYADAVRAILGAETPKVSARGMSFFNKDRWTARALVLAMCKWAKAHPGAVPTFEVVRTWCAEVNSSPIPPKEIVIASAPNNIPYSTSLALIGGAYHEAFHTRYSLRDSLNPSLVAKVVLPRWAQVADWSTKAGALLVWSNIIEDIMIERTGRVEYPGTEEMLWHLHALVLEMEEGTSPLQFQMRGHGSKKTEPNTPPATPPALQSLGETVKWVFRDRGLEYQTEGQRTRWLQYLDKHPEAVDMVVKGPLGPILKESMETLAGNPNGLVSIRLAMDVIITLADLVQDSLLDPEEGEEAEAEGGETGDGERNCPACGASADKLIVRPLRDGNNNKVPGKGICTCTVCGYQEEVNIKPSDATKKSKSKGPKFIGFDPQDLGQTPGFEPSDNDSFEGNDWSQIAQEILNDTGKETHDVEQALEDSIKNAQQMVQEALHEGERMWNPYFPEGDLAVFVPPSAKGVSYDTAQADALYAVTMDECSFLRARLSNIFRALEMVDVQHGFPTGDDLSEPLMVDTYVDIRSRQIPHRAFQRTDERIDMSFATAVVIDESGSMSSWLKEAAMTLMILTEPLDRLGIPVMVSGFRSGVRGTYRALPESGGFDPSIHHRIENHTYDVFKTFEERFTDVRWRFANTRAEGGTPMADGVMFGLAGLMLRKEHHRVLFVITDGDENGGGAEVMNWQFREAREAGIHVIGVGIGAEAANVKIRFMDHVWSETMADLPYLLISKLNDIVDNKAVSRGRMIHTEAQIVTPWD